MITNTDSNVTTSFKNKIKSIILLSGTKEDRDHATLLITKILGEKVEFLQYGFFIKTFATQLTGLSEQELITAKNENSMIRFSSENILSKLKNCIADTASRLNVDISNLTNVSLLNYLSLILDKKYLNESQIETMIHIKCNTFLQNIGEKWKIIFNKDIWAQLVNTAIKRSDKKIIVLNDFRFPEEYSGLPTIHFINTIKIINNDYLKQNFTDKLNIEYSHRYIHEATLDNFTFNYLLNYTIPGISNKEVQVSEILTDISNKYSLKILD